MLKRSVYRWCSNKGEALVEAAKSLRFLALFVAGFVLVIGTALIYSLVTQRPAQPVTVNASTAKVPSVARTVEPAKPPDLAVVAVSKSSGHEAGDGTALDPKPTHLQFSEA